MKKRRYWIAAGIVLVLVFCLNWRLTFSEVSAAWVEQVVDGTAEYSKFPLENYYLDVEASGLSGIGIKLMNGMSNVFFTMSNTLSYFAGWVLEQAYEVDFIGDAIRYVSQNIQTIAGVDSGGFRSVGFFPAFAPFLILIAGAYFVWVGIFQRKTAKAASNLVIFSVVFVFGMGVIAYAGNYLQMVNDFQRGFNEEILEISSRITLGEEGDDMVHQMRENTFVIMVRNPYLMFQYGTTDAESVGEGRINELLETEPGSDEREEIVEREASELENTYMSEKRQAERLGMCLVVLIVNLIIGVCIILFAAMIIMAQILFVLYMSFFPVALVFSLFPNSGGRIKKLLGKCLESVLMRPGISLILTVVFSISMLCYSLSGSGNYLWCMFLQGITFIVALLKTGEFLGYMSIGNERGGDRSIIRYIAGGIGARAAFKGVKNLVRRSYDGVKYGSGALVKGMRETGRYGSEKMNRGYHLKEAALQGRVPASGVEKGQATSGSRHGSKKEQNLSKETVRDVPGQNEGEKYRTEKNDKQVRQENRRMPGAPRRTASERMYQDDQRNRVPDRTVQNRTMQDRKVHTDIVRKGRNRVKK